MSCLTSIGLQLEAFTITGISQAYGTQGDVARAGGDNTRAVTVYTQALKIAEQALAMNKQLQNQEGIKSSLNIIGTFYAGLIQGYDSTKQFELALEAIRKAEKLEGLTDDVRNVIRLSELSVYYSLASAYDNPRQYARRLEILQKVIEPVKQLNDRETEGRYLVSIAQTYYFWGRYTQALDVYRQALSRTREVKDYQYEVLALLGTGSIYVAQANYPDALKIDQQALQLSRANNQAYYLELVSLNNIANVYTIQGQYAQAMSTHQQVLATHQKRYEAYSKGVTPDNIRAVCLAGGNFRETAGTDSKVGSLSEICDNPAQLPTGSRLNNFKSMIHTLLEMAQSGIATSFSSIAGLYADQGNYPKALEFNEKALEIFREQSDRSREATSLNNIGTVYLGQGNYAKALKVIQQALNLAVEQNNPANETLYQRNLGLT